MMCNYGLLFKRNVRTTYSLVIQRGEVKSIEGKFTAFFSGRREQNSTPAVAAAAAVSLLVFFKDPASFLSVHVSGEKNESQH